MCALQSRPKRSSRQFRYYFVWAAIELGSRPWRSSSTIVRSFFLNRLVYPSTAWNTLQVNVVDRKITHSLSVILETTSKKKNPTRYVNIWQIDWNYENLFYFISKLIPAWKTTFHCCFSCHWLLRSRAFSWSVRSWIVIPSDYLVSPFES